MTTSKKKQQKVIEMFKNGHKLAEIARVVKIVKNTVKRILRSNGLLPYPNPKRQQYGPPSPFDYYTNSTNEKLKIKQLEDNLQMANSMGGNLRRELDKKNQENENLTQKLTEETTEKERLTKKLTEESTEKERLNQKLTQKTADLEKTQMENQKMIIEKGKLLDITYQQEIDNDKLYRVKQDLEKTVKDKQDLITKNKNDYQKQNDQKILNLKKEFLKNLNKFNDKLDVFKNENNDLKETLKKTINERDNLKNEVWELKLEQKNSTIKYATVGIIGFGTGLGFGWWLRGNNNNPTSPTKTHYAKKPVNCIPLTEENNINQTETQDNNNSINIDINNSGTPNYSADNYNNTFVDNADLNNPAFTNIPQRVNVTANCGIINKTNTSTDPCVGEYSSNNINNTVSGHIIFSNQQEKPNQPDINNRYNIETYTYDYSYSGINNGNYNGYLDYRPELKKAYYVNQAQQTGYIPYTPSFTKPFDYYLPFTNRYNIKNILKTMISQYISNDKTGTRFEDILEKFFIHIGGKVIRTPKTNDKGADLIVYLGNDVNIIQAKDRKDKITITAIQEIHGAKSYYDNPKPNRAIVIATNEFTKQALDYAEKLAVECWDYEKLLDEMVDYHFYL